MKDILFSPDGQYIASAFNCGDVVIWNVRMGQLVKKLMEHRKWVDSIAFTPDGMGLVCGGSIGTVKLWDMSFLKMDGPGSQPLEDGDNNTGKELLNFRHKVCCFCPLSTYPNSLTVFFSFPPSIMFSLSPSRPMAVGWSLVHLMEHTSGMLTMLSCIVS